MNGGLVIFTNSAAVVGMGSRRVCYRTSHPSLCAKVYRPNARPSKRCKLGIRLHLFVARHNRWLNVNLLEWSYLNLLRRRLPQELLHVFPEHVEPFYSETFGWCLLESLILNADGTPARRVSHDLRHLTDQALRRRIYHKTERLLDLLQEHLVRFFDIDNLLIQWNEDGSFNLRIADFEPYGRELFCCLTALPPIYRSKMRRRINRYMAKLRATVFVGDIPYDSRPLGNIPTFQ